MPCSPLLRRWIEEAGGLLPFEVFVARALHDPEHGYYASGARDVGRGGDFSTAATLSDRLARAVAGWAEEAAPGLPLVEIGPGGGQLAAALLRLRGGPLHLVEPSETLRALQARRLAGWDVRWHASVAEALDAAGGRAVVVANEVVDAFPFAVLRWSGAGWERLWLALDGAEVAEVFRPLGGWLPDPDLPPDLAARWPRPSALARDWPPGQRVEVPVGLGAWWAAWAPRLREGAVLLVDYGDRVEGLYHRRPGGTARGHLAHLRREGRELYEGVGRTDLTFDVNFTDLEAWARALGFRVAAHTTQAEFLARRAPLGDDPEPADAFVGDPRGMGGAFRVLGLVPGG